jgi:hypothetical protein
MSSHQLAAGNLHHGLLEEIPFLLAEGSLGTIEKTEIRDHDASYINRLILIKITAERKFVKWRRKS